MNIIHHLLHEDFIFPASWSTIVFYLLFIWFFQYWFDSLWIQTLACIILEGNIVFVMVSGWKTCFTSIMLLSLILLFLFSVFSFILAFPWLSQLSRLMFPSLRFMRLMFSRILLEILLVFVTFISVRILLSRRLVKLIAWRIILFSWFC